MIDATEPITAERAPCGRVKDGHRHKEDDDQGLVYDDLTYTCGCRRFRRQFHDGSIRIKTLRHDGKVLTNENSGEREA